MSIGARLRAFLCGALSCILLLSAQGCRSGDPAPGMIVMVDSMPPEKRPPDWEHTKTLMSRKAPEVGSIAPDFALSNLDSSEPVRLSTYHPGRPKVLIFASFT